MKVEENVLYYTKDFVKGYLIDPDDLELDTSVSISKIEMNEAEAKDLKNLLLSNVTENRHKCLSVYRHSFIYDGDVYNICLSCGDLKINALHHYLSKVPVENYIKYER